MFLHENNRNYNFYRFSDKFAFPLFSSFITSQNKNQVFNKLMVW